MLEVDPRMRDDNDDDMCHTALTDADSPLFYKSHTWQMKQNQQAFTYYLSLQIGRSEIHQGTGASFKF